MINYNEAQRKYDNQLPEDTEYPDPDTCKHEWKVTKCVDDGEEFVREFRCKLCGKIDCD